MILLVLRHSSLENHPLFLFAPFNSHSRRNCHDTPNVFKHIFRIDRACLLPKSRRVFLSGCSGLHPVPIACGEALRAYVTLFTLLVIGVLVYIK